MFKEHPEYVLSIHHCISYPCVSRPESVSTEGSHSHVGVLSLLGVSVLGVPGVVGIVASIVKVSVPKPARAVVLKAESVALMYMVCVPSVREGVVQVYASLNSSIAPSEAVQLVQDPKVLST